MTSTSWRVVSYYLSRMFLLMSLTSIAPLIVSILLAEKPLFILLVFAVSIALYALSWILSRVSTYGEIDIVSAMVVSAITFIVAGISASIPIMVYDEPINALFEGISAITTTGLSCLRPEALSPGVHFLRAYYQWIGGLGIALITISFFISPGTPAYNIYAVHLGREKLKPLSYNAVRLILKIYITLTIIYLLVYLALGFPLLDGIINSLTTISTGGFSTIPIFSSTGTLLVVSMLMLISAQPIALYYYFYKGRLKEILREPQLRSFITIILLSTMVVTLIEGIPVTKAFFQTVSALSTTGYTSLDNNLLTDSSKLILSILMIIGAGFGSTGGGIKQLRIIIIGKSIINQLAKPLLPRRAVTTIRIAGKPVEKDEVMWAYMLLIAYLVVLLVSTLIFTIYGYNLSNSLFETSSALATTGLSIGLSGPALEAPLKIVLMIDMLFGRVEIIPYIYLLIAPWRRTVR